MSESSSLLAFVAREIGTIDARHVGRRSTGQAGGVVRGPGELVVGSPELVELQSKFRATGIRSRR